MLYGITRLYTRIVSYYIQGGHPLESWKPSKQKETLKWRTTFPAFNPTVKIW